MFEIDDCSKIYCSANSTMNTKHKRLEITKEMAEQVQKVVRSAKKFFYNGNATDKIPMNILCSMINLMKRRTAAKKKKENKNKNEK